MKANNLTISIPYRGCDKDCPYCVSKMTGPTKSDESTYLLKLHKVRKFAENCGVTNVLITGKGEPFLNKDALTTVIHEFKDFPLEIQTNGIYLNKNYKHLYYKEISLLSVDVFAFSLDSTNTFGDYKDLFESIAKFGSIIRVTMNVSKNIEGETFDSLINKCLEHNIQQFSLRKLTVPKESSSSFEEYEKARKWILENATGQLYDKFIQEFSLLRLDTSPSGAHPIRDLPFGATIYDYKGVAVTFFDYCIQEFNHSDDIRSLIYQEDGHLYTSWNSKASILF